MALYEVVKPCKVVQNDKVVMLRNVGAIVDLEPDALAELKDAVKPLGTADDAPAAEPEQPSGEQQPEQPTPEPSTEPEQTPNPEPTPDPVADPTPEERRQRRGRGSTDAN